HDVKKASTEWKQKQARDKRVLRDMTNSPTAGRKRKNHDTNAMGIPSKRIKVAANNVTTSGAGSNTLFICQEEALSHIPPVLRYSSFACSSS
ncbi:13571_t:CDS:2, partial [Racocetra persica]